MKTLNISISDSEFDKLGLKNEKISFNDFLEIINKELQKLNLRKSIEMAEKYGLSKMSNGEINEEVKAVRKSAKSNN